MSTTTQAPARLTAAQAKSEQMFYYGSLPAYRGRRGDDEEWLVESRTGSTPDPYLILVSGGQPVACSCAAKTERCWHRAHVARALAGDVPFVDPDGVVRWMEPPAPARACRRCGQVLAGPACLDCDLAPPPAPARPPLPREAIFGRAVQP